MTYLQLIGGLAVLLVGAEALVRGASRLAASFGVSRLVVGLTVVAFGTSAPELVISVSAATSGASNIALGNVVGSNIANILFILGLSAAILPIAVVQRVIRWDIPLMIVVSLVFAALALDGRISAYDGFALFTGILVYTWWNLRESRRSESSARSTEREPVPVHAFVLTVAGLAALWLGGRWFVTGAVGLARSWELNELVIGLTIVALGTSLPEAATSIVASIRGESDIAVGNIVGSNVFNILAVMGVASLVAPDGVAVAPTALRFDIPVMIAASAACVPIAFTGAIIARWEGALLLGYYGAYVSFIVMAARAPSLASEFGHFMVVFVVPLTAATLLLFCVDAHLRKKRTKSGQSVKNPHKVTTKKENAEAQRRRDAKG